MNTERLTEKAFCRKMTLFFLTILACAAMMASSAYALFFKHISAQNSTLVGAYYTVEVTNTANNTLVAPLAYEDMHVFTITSRGTASKGYCKIGVNDNTYYTVEIPKDQSITITIKAARDSVITFTPQWGAQTEIIASMAYKDGDTVIDSVTPHATYTVEPAARLSAIAEYYGVPEADIIIYNNLVATADESGNTSVSLQTENGLKIPGAEASKKEAYKVPFSTYTVEPTAKLEDVARYYEVPVADILAFNKPEDLLVRQTLKIPYAAQRAVPYAVPFATYKVEATAKLKNISDHYKISEADILAYNNITAIKVGELLKIPGVSPDTKAYAVPFREYRIEPTARIGDISIYYGVSVEDIFIYNNITNGMIIAGTVLKIPSPKEVPIDYKVPHTIYTVEPTAKIEDIAKHYGVTPDMIKRFNYIEAIATGMQLKIPYPVTSELYKIPFAAYTVPEGATLENIAKHYNIAPADIQAFNPNIEIKAGAAIRIPGVAPDSPPYIPPAKTEEKKQ
ncbi:MAG: LysM peptidoglycan-binding domain-containing protein [Clostridia bacterium]|nr:LysM peptidoglycan-binding domain-containing protein [Clostridia bacterium]